MFEKYTEEQISNPKGEIVKDIYKFMKESKFLNKLVWFTIAEAGSEYRLIMYYDNGYNAANGEDL